MLRIIRLMILIRTHNPINATQPFEDYGLYSNRSVLIAQIGNDAFRNLSRYFFTAIR